MVAPSFESYAKVSEPYEKNGKMYIDVEHPNTHNVRSVRFYSEAEYTKAYGARKATVTKPLFDRRIALGFGEKNYITIFKGVKSSHEDFFNKSNARFATFFGWYVPSSETIPQNLPEGVIPVKLDWETAKTKMEVK